MPCRPLQRARQSVMKSFAPALLTLNVSDERTNCPVSTPLPHVRLIAPMSRVVPVDVGRRHADDVAEVADRIDAPGRAPVSGPLLMLSVVKDGSLWTVTLALMLRMPLVVLPMLTVSAPAAFQIQTGWFANVLCTLTVSAPVPVVRFSNSTSDA